MDKNTITGLVLIFLIFIGFSIFNSSRLNKSYEKVIVTADSLYSTGDLENARAEYLNALRFKPNSPDAVSRVNEINQKLGFVKETPEADTITAINPAPDTSSRILPDSLLNLNRFGAFAASATGDDEYITLENNRMELKIALKGGRVYSARLKDFVTHDGKPLILFSGDSTEFGFNFFTADNRAIRTNDLWFSQVADSKVVSVTGNPGSVVLRLPAGDDSYIEYNYTLEPDKYTVDFNVTFKSMEGVIASNVNSITLDWKMYIPQQEKG
ncbi:MAG: YidC/Oxa1 family insertase periplasmic-domain containing protein, partial [Bacteroidales bacterium]|nr:YidC/Oxa1 family insertase periplasmic-domain containing protein [Bacteroidales bacterium]